MAIISHTSLVLNLMDVPLRTLMSDTFVNRLDFKRTYTQSALFLYTIIVFWFFL